LKWTVNERGQRVLCKRTRNPQTGDIDGGKDMGEKRKRIDHL